MQELAECVFDTIQRDRLVVAGHFAEVEEDVIQRLQQVMTALGANQIDLLVGIVDALARRYVHERDGTALIVREVDETAALAQALFPRQHPAFAKHAVHIQITGVEARPLDGHQARQAEVNFIGDQLAARGGVDRVASQTTDGTARHRFYHIAAGNFAGHETCCEFKCAGQHCFHARLCPCLKQLGNTARRACHRHQHIDGGAQPAWNFVVYRQIAIPAAADEHVVGAARDGRAAGEFVALARRGHAVDEDVGRAFGDPDRPRMLFAGTDAFLDMRRLTVVDVHIGRGRDDGAGRGGKHTPDCLSCGGEQATSDACCKSCQKSHAEPAREGCDRHRRNERNTEYSPDQESSQGAGMRYFVTKPRGLEHKRYSCSRMSVGVV
ncbi:hypothetical protein ALP62_05518 [Pseudomonas syringae pv. aceris]|nr:hypothetical protein ALP62_05518 [Pseudomonas syringae pv. aceris]